jgi:hypothetical protein
MAEASRTEAKHRNVVPAKSVVRLETETLAPLNFKVSRAFRREFKTYASQHDMKMVDLLHEAFRLVKEQYDRAVKEP